MTRSSGIRKENFSIQTSEVSAIWSEWNLNNSLFICSHLYFSEALLDSYLPLTSRLILSNGEDANYFVRFSVMKNINMQNFTTQAESLHLSFSLDILTLMLTGNAC